MKSLEIMVIDDEPAIRQILAAHLSKAGYHVTAAANGLDAYKRLAQGDIEIAICDIKMPDISGIELVQRVRAAGIDTNFIMMTAFASVDTAIEAIQAGASDYMIKPVRNQEVMHRLLKIADLRGLRAENQVLRSLVQGKKEDYFSFQSAAMQDIERLISKVAPTDSTVLVTGASGTGKGIIARRIHKLSTRSNEPFIPVNCGALPENLMESELFGHTKGAFTGADKPRKGLFMEADKGTIFLDEIGELPLLLQVKLLHVIEEKSVRAVGSEQMRRADVRIIAATNRNLEQMVAEGKFRQDLYFRLSVFHIHAPLLKERRQDIPQLVQFLMERGADHLKIAQQVTLDPEVEELFVCHDWPGNIREMENVIDRSLILADNGCITLADLPTQMLHGPSSGVDVSVATDDSGTLRDQIRRFEHGVICRIIQDVDGDRRMAAQRLGIGLSSLYRKIEDLEAFGLVVELEKSI
jgi:two-component system response regulator AtoC